MTAAIIKLQDENLIACAARIRSLMGDWAKNTLDLGREIKRARDSFPVIQGNHRPGWTEWVERETGLKCSWARVLIKIYEKFDGQQIPSNLSPRILGMLAADRLAPKVREEILSRANAGERITRFVARKIIDDRTRLSEEDMHCAHDDREHAKQISQAISAMSAGNMTPQRFMQFAGYRDLSEKKIAAACTWISSLGEVWRSRQ